MHTKSVCRSPLSRRVSLQGAWFAEALGRTTKELDTLTEELAQERKKAEAAETRFLEVRKYSIFGSLAIRLPPCLKFRSSDYAFGRSSFEYANLSGGLQKN